MNAQTLKIHRDSCQEKQLQYRPGLYTPFQGKPSNHTKSIKLLARFRSNTHKQSSSSDRRVTEVADKLKKTVSDRLVMKLQLS